MSIGRFNFKSQSIGRWADITITYPTTALSYYDTEKGYRHHDKFLSSSKFIYRPGMKFQTVYLIHGGGDDDTLPYRYTNVERYAERNNIMLVTPNIANSFGVNTNYGVDYSTFITEELPVIIQSLFASSPKREDNFIVGYAMGGNAALGSALTHPGLYSVCVDMSGGIGLTLNTETLKAELEGEHFRNDFPLVNATFGEAADLEASRHNLRAIAQKNIDCGTEAPKFYFIAGSEEGFIRDRVKDDADIMKKIGYDATYICAEGYKHGFPLWDKYLAIVFDEILPLKRAPLYY